MENSKSKQPPDLQEHLQSRLDLYVMSGQRVCVALSGGLDSVVLLHAATEIAKAGGTKPIAAHVHHGISPNADAWEAFCREQCAKHGVKFYSKRVDVSLKGEGVEAAARNARYAAFEAIDCDWMLLAHHRDDQAETVLLNLLRGAGVHGTAAMNEIRGKFLRPLLDVPRVQILEYAQQHSLSWIEDESNADGRYNRNFLRNDVMPLLTQPFPQAAGNLARAARAFRNAAELLDDVAHEDMRNASYIIISRLKTLTTSRATNVLAYYLRQQGLQIPGSARLNEMLRQILTAAEDSAVCIAIADHEIRRFNDRVWVEEAQRTVAPISWPGSGTLSWGKHEIEIREAVGDGVSIPETAKSNFQFSGRRSGSVMQLHPDGPRRQLKDILREAGVPPWRRNYLPMLYAGEEVAWVAGIGVSAKYRCKPGMTGFLIEFDGVTW